MLTQFSWYQFALAIGVGLLLYYTLVTLLFFRHSLRTLLNKVLTSLPLARQAASNQVTGPAQPDPASLLVDAAALVVAPASGQEETAAGRQPEELMADLLAELQDLLDLAAGNPAGKADFCQLLRLVTSRYGSQLPDRLQDQAQAFVLEQARDRLPFALSAADLQACWPPAADQV